MSKTYCVGGVRVPLSDPRNHAVVAAIQENKEIKGKWDVIVMVGNFDEEDAAENFGNALRPILDDMLGGITDTTPIREH